MSSERRYTRNLGAPPTEEWDEPDEQGDEIDSCAVYIEMAARLSAMADDVRSSEVRRQLTVLAGLYQRLAHQAARSTELGTETDRLLLSDELIDDDDQFEPPPSRSQPRRRIH
jgi:hypothetical protein